MDWEPHDRHWIRLRGPWQVAWIGDGVGDAQSRRVTMPASWRSLFGDLHGTSQFTRRFNRPSGLDPEERVIVTLTNLSTETSIVSAMLNGHVLPPIAPIGDEGCWPAKQCLCFDVTERLEPANLLRFDVSVSRDADFEQSGLHEPVLLEIICPN